MLEKIVILPRLGWVVWLTMLGLSACSFLPEREPPTQTAPAAQDSQPEAQPELPSVELDSELLYEFLVGEIAIQRDDLELAAQSLTSAAIKTEDYRLAQRATRVALKAKSYSHVMQAATLWLKLQPDAEAPIQAMVIVLLEQGNIDDAEAKAMTLFESKPDQMPAIYRRISNLLGRQPKGENSMQLMDRLVQHHPDSADAHFALAYVAGRFDIAERVIPALDRALELKPNWEEAVIAKLSYLMTHEAEREIIENIALEFLDRNPGANDLRLQLARYFVEQRALEEAVTQFDILVAKDPSNPDSLFAAALLSIQLERFDAAEKYLMKNLALDSDNDQVRLYLGRVAIQGKDYADAERWLQQIKDENYYLDAQILIADIYAQTRDVDAALAHLQSLEPDDQDQYVSLLMAQEDVLRKAKDLERAKSILDEAVDRFPDNTDILYARGLLAAQMNLVDVHERDMRKLLDKDPKNAHALNALGYTLADATERVDEAHELIQQALALRPDDPFILDSMGWVQYRMGNFELAIEYLERALGERPDAEIAAHLGEVLWITGEEERAKEIWQKSLKDNPDNDLLRGTIERFHP